MDTASHLQSRMEKPKVKFTGKRRPKIRKVCGCGCGKKFTTTNPRKIYKDDAHRMRKNRARMRTKLQSEV